MRTQSLIQTSLVVLALLFTSPAAAQDAKSLLKKGNQLFSSGDYLEAYKVFEQGHKAAPKKPVFMRSMAFSQLKLFKHEKARALLQKYLKQFKRIKDRKKIKDLVDSLDVVVQTKLHIESTPTGAEIFIDAEAAGKVDKTPADLTMQPGKHLVILKKDGFFVTTLAFNIKAKETKNVKVALEIPLKVSSEPTGGSVHLGSPTAQSLGNAPLETGIKPGVRKVYVKLAGYKTYEKSLKVAGKPHDKPIEVHAAMELGIKVASTPPGASVSIDGKPVAGVTPLEAGITPGSHAVTVTLAGYKPATEKVQIAPGKVADVNVTLAGGGVLSMRTDVAGAAVKLGDLEVGTTPFDNLAVPSGSQNVTVNHPDRRPWSKALEFGDSEAISAELRLGRPTWPVWVAGGVSLAAIIAGSVTGIIVKGHHDDFENAENQSLYCDNPDNYCSNSLSHLSTASFITAGVAAAAGAVYYFVFARHGETITRKAAGTTASR
jgi:PEGA domain